MSNPGDTCYVSVSDPLCGLLKFKGFLVDKKSRELVAAVNAASRLVGIADWVVQLVDDQTGAFELCFITAPKSAATLERPAAWSLKNSVPIKPMLRENAGIPDALSALYE